MTQKYSRTEYLERCDRLTEFKEFKDVFLSIEYLIAEILVNASDSDFYSLRMVRMDPQRKIQQIQFHRSVSGMGLKDSKDFIESASNRFLGITLHKKIDKKNLLICLNNYIEKILDGKLNDFDIGLYFELEVNKNKEEECKTELE